MMMMLVMMMMMVMMDIWWCRYLGWYIDPLLSKQHPWWLKTLGLGGQTTTFQVFANPNKCASCQQEYSHTSTFSYSLILKRIMTISITKNHQLQLILISCFANSAEEHLWHIFWWVWHLFCNFKYFNSETYQMCQQPQYILTFCQNFCQFMTKISPPRAKWTNITTSTDERRKKLSKYLNVGCTKSSKLRSKELLRSLEKKSRCSKN